MKYVQIWKTKVKITVTFIHHLAAKQASSTAQNASSATIGMSQKNIA
jgi:hypothetical protein